MVTKMKIDEDENSLSIRGEDSYYNSAGISLKPDGSMIVWGQGGECCLFTPKQTEKILSRMNSYIVKMK